MGAGAGVSSGTGAGVAACPGAVSYTHLDVYKRQVTMWLHRGYKLVTIVKIILTNLHFPLDFRIECGIL